jgi:hypothetical protein
MEPRGIKNLGLTLYAISLVNIANNLIPSKRFIGRIKSQKYKN